MRRTTTMAIVLILALVLAMSLIACSSPEQESDQDATTPPPQDGSDSSMGDVISAEVSAKVNEIYGAATIEAQTISSVQELAIITSINYSRGTGPITVTPARMGSEDITLVTLSGTEFKEGQATTINESKLASMGKNNDYLRAVVKLFKNNTIPRGKPVIVTGISLGGMIAQQLLGESFVMNNYDIRAIITFGSPFTLPTARRDVEVIRYTDSNDVVPKAGELGIYNQIMNGVNLTELKAKIAELNRRECIVESGNVGNPLETHALSYISAECWDKYDILGGTDKKTTIELLQPLTFYEAPIITK